MPLNLNHLNRAQQSAVLHPLGPLLILAGAGSGKTSTMAYRMAHLMIERNVPPSSVLGLSFTNKAATELRERVIRLVKESSQKKMQVRGLRVTTFHSLCARILREHGEKLGFRSQFTILDQNDQTDVLKQVLKNIRIDDRKFDPEVILFEMGQAKNRFLAGDHATQFFLDSGRLSPDYALAAASSFAHYQDQLKVLNAMDFDDLIYYTVKLLSDFHGVREYYNSLFRHILVDEYQDTNPAQFKILQLLTEAQKNLCVVGDDDQSIYSWRGSDPKHILEFKNHYPDSEMVILDQNYRSTSRILEGSFHIINKNQNRFAKKLWSDRGEGSPLMEVLLEDDRAEAEYVAEEILRRTDPAGSLKEGGLDTPFRLYKNFAVLYRSNSQSRVFEEAFRRKGIPYQIVGGLSFLDRKEVKNVLAYWRILANFKDDPSLRRILNWPARGIGKTSVDTISASAFQRQISFFEAMGDTSSLTPRTLTACLQFKDLLLELRRSLEQCATDSASLAAWGRQFLEKVQIKKAIEEDADDPVQAAKKWENVEELLHSIGQIRLEDDLANQGALAVMQDFLNRMTLEAQETEKDEEKKERDTERNQVTLLTLHGAKGLEYPVVFLVGMEEGFLPHKRTLEESVDLGEERRLCYVGMTRAKDHLLMTRVKHRIRYGKPVPRVPSRFLEEIPSELLVRVNESEGPRLDDRASEIEHENRVKDHLAAIRAQLLKK